MQNQDYLKRQIEERRQDEKNFKMSDAEYRLNKELLETIKCADHNKTNFSNKIF